MSFIAVSADGRFHGTEDTVADIFAMSWLRIVVPQDTDTNSFSNICDCGDKEVVVITPCPVRPEINRFYCLVFGLDCFQEILKDRRNSKPILLA